MTPQDLIAKAERAIGSATLLQDHGDVDGACNRAYYAMFDAARAALLATVPGIDPAIGKTHNGLIAKFGLHMVKTGLVPVEFGRAFNRAQEIRQVADYTGDVLELSDVDWIVQHATDFVKMIKERFVGEPVSGYVG